MASIHWRRKSRKVYVYYTDPKTHKLKQLARKETKHLDGKPPHVAHAWVEQWEKDNGIIRNHVFRKTLKEDDKLLAQWKQYQEFKESDNDQGNGRRKRTVEAEKSLFLNHIVPFFVYQHERKDPSDWHPFIPAFHKHLSKVQDDGNPKLSAATRRAILWTLKRFGESLVFSQDMTFPFVVRPPHSKVEKVTPLKVRKNPEEILAFVKANTFSQPKSRVTAFNPDGKRSDIDFNLAILLGYFGGFGPGELFAIEKSDFLTGNYAVLNSKTYSGFCKHGLGSKLSVVVCKTLPHVGEPVDLMKNDYRFGVTNIWNKEAAELIAKILKSRPDGRLFPFSYAYLVRRWREIVFPKLKVKPHDLRRASGLYLGREKRIELTLLQDHMRHAEVETTMLYTRDPAVPEIHRLGKQDLDDVA